MSDKSELEYLEEAMSGMAYANLNDIRRAIDLRKQDLAKADAALLYTNREKLYMDTPQNVPNTADNTPKGGGEVPDLDPEALSKAASDDSQTRIDRIVKGDTLGPQSEFVAAFLCGAKYRYRAISTRYDALLAERDALSAHDSQCIKDRVSFCEEIEELEAVVERRTAERDAARAELREAVERGSILEAAIKSVLAGTCANWPDTLRAALDRVGKQP